MTVAHRRYDDECYVPSINNAHGLRKRNLSDKAYLFIPDVMPVANGERNVEKLNAAHTLGLAQARRELPAIKEFLGLA
ncbi:hypothetical protein GCM10009720_12620 [Yaniella flava]|uniref:DUF6363 domain-containing protein n=1 Tax=Yaniella flava TaxID=287930 RepID=A0ABN2UCY5_9MICC